MAIVAKEGEREQPIVLPTRMAEILGLQNGLPVGAFREITGATQGLYDDWTRRILDDPVAIEALKDADTIVELGCGPHAATTGIIVQMLRQAGFPLPRSAVVMDFNPTIADNAVANVKKAGIEDVRFQLVDFRTPEGLEEIKRLGGEGSIVAARALLNQVGRGADHIISDVFPAYEKGVVLDLAHPQKNPDAWQFRAVDSKDFDAVQAIVAAEKLTGDLYRLLEADGRKLWGAELKERLTAAGLNVVHCQLVPEYPWREPVADPRFAGVPRAIAAVVAYNRREDLPVDLQEFEGLLRAYDDFLRLLQEGDRIEVSAIQFGGAVCSGRR